MAVNLRNRMEGCHDGHAGNYESGYRLLPFQPLTCRALTALADDLVPSVGLRDAGPGAPMLLRALDPLSRSGIAYTRPRSGGVLY
eukprot:1830840-Rhodomonas_salina.3